MGKVKVEWSKKPQFKPIEVTVTIRFDSQEEVQNWILEKEEELSTVYSVELFDVAREVSELLRRNDIQE